MGPVRGTLVRPVAWLAGVVGRHPFRVAGLVAVLAGSAAAVLSVGGDASGVTAAGLVAFALARPAYAAAAVAGGLALLRPGS